MTNSLKTCLLGTALCCVLGAAPAAAAVQIAVVHVFVDPLTDIIDDFVADNPQYVDVEFDLTPGSSGGFYSEINTALGNSSESPYNMYFSADSSYPALLYASWSPTVGTPFQYAQGSLMLVSNNVVDVTSGLPTGYGNTGIANANGTIPPVIPTGAPYGDAALDVLQNLYSIPSTSSTINATFASPGAVLNAVKVQSVNTGFLAKRQVCNTSNGTIDTSSIATTGVTYHEYTPGTGYSASVLLQSGNVIARSSSSSHEADAVADLAAYMSSATAQTIIQNYCFTIPTAKVTAAQSYASVKALMKKMIRKPTKAKIEIHPGH